MNLYEKVAEKLRAHPYAKAYPVLAAFLFYSFIVFGPFLSGLQRVHDSYLVERFGGYGFMANMLFNQGRVLSSWYYRVLLFLGPPYNGAMAVSVGLSLIFLSIAAYIVFCQVRKFAPPETCRNHYVFAAMGSGMIFFNVFIAESMIFFENAIMSLGILLAVLASDLFLRGGRKGYLGSLICLIVSMFSYQASSVFFPPLVILFLGAKYKEQLSLLLRKISFAALIYGAALLVNFIFLLLVSDDVRFAGEVNLLWNIYRSLLSFLWFGLNNFGFMPDFVFSLFLLAFLGILIYTCRKRKEFKLLLISLIAFIAVFATNFLLLLPMASDDWYILPRSAVAMAGIGGFMIISIALCAKKIHKSTLLLTAVFVLMVSHVQLDIQRNNYANNQLDMQELHQIVETIRAYETYHGLEVNRVLFAYETPREWQRETLSHYNDLTVRILRVSWMPEPLLWRYFGRDLVVLPMSEALSQEEMERISGKRESHWFTNGRLVFEGGSVYIFFENDRPPEPAASEYQYTIGEG